MPAQQGQTDEILKVTLKSEILAARWVSADVSPGGKAALEVKTLYVGEGAPIKITFKDLEGKSLGTSEGQVMSNIHRAFYLPKGENKSGGVTFEAELPKHGLKMAGGKIKVAAPIEFSGLRFLDAKGKALTEINEGQEAACEAKVKGLKDGDKVIVSVYLRTDLVMQDGHLFIESEVAVKDGKVVLHFNPRINSKLDNIKIQLELDKEGGTYFQPEYVFTCLAKGTRASSEGVKIVQDFVLNFWQYPGDAGALEGTSITLVGPDGKEAQHKIPKDGRVEVKGAKPGKTKVKPGKETPLKTGEAYEPLGAGTAITEADKKTLVEYIATFEGGKGKKAFSAINPDLEFEGRWDKPKGWYKDKTRATPDSPDASIPYSKYFSNPKHVGLTFGLIQFTQASSLGDLLALMNTKDSAKFKEIFGEHSDALLTMTAKNGKLAKFEEEIFDNTGASMGTKMVGRVPSVHPVGGHELWQSYWVEKFKLSGQHPAFQEAQVECAVTKYMDACIKQIKGKGIKKITEKSLSLFFDRQVNGGGGAAKVILAKYIGTKDEKKFWKDFISGKKDSVKRRMNEIYDSAKVSWDKVYEL